MKLKLLAVLISVGMVSSAGAQTSVNLTVDGSPYSGGDLDLNSMSFNGGVLSIDVTSSNPGGGGGGTDPDPTEHDYTLTVNSTSNGDIVRTSNSQSVSGTSIPFSYTSNDATPTITLRLEPANGYEASSWGGACSSRSASQNCTVEMGGNRTVSATFQPVSTGDCPAVSSNVTIKDTGASGTDWPSSGSDQIANSATSESRIFAYRFRTGPSGTTGSATATRISGGEGKLLVMTKCPGDVSNPAPAVVYGTVESSVCNLWTSEATTLSYRSTTNLVGFNNASSCPVEPNSTYYINVVNAASKTNPPTCGSSCGFRFVRN